MQAGGLSVSQDASVPDHLVDTPAQGQQVAGFPGEEFYVFLRRRRLHVINRPEIMDAVAVEETMGTSGFANKSFLSVKTFRPVAYVVGNKERVSRHGQSLWCNN
jgi:hypothetical protein